MTPRTARAIGTVSLAASLALGIATAVLADPTVTTPGNAPLVVDATSVAVPWGNWLSIILTGVWGVIGTTVVGFIYTSLRGPLSWFITQQTLTTITNAIIAQTAGALVGRTLPVTVVNDILNRAVLDFIANEPRVAAYMGGLLKPFVLSLLVQHGMVPAEAHVDPQGDAEHRLDMTPPSPAR